MCVCVKKGDLKGWSCAHQTHPPKTSRGNARGPGREVETRPLLKTLEREKSVFVTPPHSTPPPEEEGTPKRSRGVKPAVSAERGRVRADVMVEVGVGVFVGVVVGVRVMEEEREVDFVEVREG